MVPVMNNRAVLVVKNRSPAIKQSYLEYYGHLNLADTSEQYLLYAPCLLIDTYLCVGPNTNMPMSIDPDDVLEVKMLSESSALVYDTTMKSLLTTH